MQKHKPPLKRTEWAERHVEEFVSLPLISEFVFRSPQTIDGTQREVADLLVAHGDIAILISQKCQEDPTSRNLTRTISWACKEAKKAVSQLRGALRTAKGKAVWCTHPRRGRVEFPNGLPNINHGIVLIEVHIPVDLQSEAADLPLEFQGTPITYLSVNDFLNLASELRTTPELLQYLTERHALSASGRRIIGDEKTLFEFYLLNDGSLPQSTSRADARKVVDAQRDRLRRILKAKLQSDKYSGLLEHVADQLATRNPDYAAGISPPILAKFDPPTDRTTYLEMQGVLANLRLRERAELGQSFHGVIEKLRGEPDGLVYMAAHLDSHQEWVFVFGSCKNMDRGVVLERTELLVRAAMAQYGKKRSLAVVDRDGLSYEVLFARMASCSTLAEREAGERLFGHLRMADKAISLVPNTR
jgi:hypothetical protein